MPGSLLGPAAWVLGLFARLGTESVRRSPRVLPSRHPRDPTVPKNVVSIGAVGIFSALAAEGWGPGGFGFQVNPLPCHTQP